ncbi:MAG: CPBP family intramembrane metalloprotease [Chloroflexota bacterium]|nr:CPBP family intramembrane metalloprotease [Chloroflexota bacterium]PLS78145.1 MAG: CPBP family intramembrane metalloprotease domain-containing protein [Chloroflexota bacterium]
MLNSTTPVLETERQSTVKGWPLGLTAAILMVLYVVAAVVGGEIRQIVLASVQTVPFVILAILAYLGITQTWAKVLTLVWLGILVAGFGIAALGLSFAALLDNPAVQPGTLPRLADGGGAQLLGVAVGSLVAVGIGALGFIPGVRRWLSRFLPLNPQSFVHTIALVAVVALTLLCFVPLIALGEPPFLRVVANASEQGTDLMGGRSDNGMLRDSIYGLLWTIPAAILAVGYAVRRDLGAALVRLGFVRPTLRQVLIGIGLAVVLVIVATLLGTVVDQIWDALGWPKTDGEAFDEVLAFAFSPLGAVVLGVTAGLGEELAVRGVLQPRLGILVSNLFFISLHAFQYNWNTLLVIFVVGLTLGVIRKRTNTTTSAITHGVYDFILVMLTVLQVPMFSE